jgi:hypothetical protein
MIGFFLNALWDQLLSWIWVLVAVAALALLIGGIFSPLYRFLLVGLGIVAALAAGWLYVQHRDAKAYRSGYADAEILWSDKYETLVRQHDKFVTDLQQTETAERLRQDAENRRIRDEAAIEVSRLEAERAQLATELEEMAREADADPDRDRLGIGADSVRRIDQSGRASGSGARP